MKKAIVEVPTSDYAWFVKLMAQQDWFWEWTNNGEEYPDYVED